MGDDVPLSVSDFCNINKRIQRLTIRTGAVMGREVREPEVEIPKIQRTLVGIDYAKKIMAEEEKRLVAGGQPSNLHGLALPGAEKPNQCEMEDLTSIGTLPNLNDVEADDLLDVYNNYDFTPKLSNLPIDKKRAQIVRMVETNQVVIILGATGCGKTTQVPQFILDHHAKQRKRCNIIVTQPRRIAASSVAKRVCDERGWELKTIVGYQIGLDNSTSPDTRLTYCTTAVLREKLVRERNMLAYTHVIIDEVHERDLETDFIMLIVRKLLRSNSRTVKVILMSATIDPSRFADYFSLPIRGKLIPAPILDIEKRTNFDVTEFYLDQLEDLDKSLHRQLMPQFGREGPQVYRDAMELAAKLIMLFDTIDFKEFSAKHDRAPTDEDNYKRAVLVFLPGIHEIEAMHELLLEKSKLGRFNWHQIPLHSSIAREDQQAVFRKPAKTYRKIILSTNIAESSITVPDIVYVIDFCLLKHLVCDPVTNFTSLRCAWASHSNCKQRAGRAGRLQNGRVYRMIPRTFYEKMLPEDSDPEMVRCPLTLTVLKAKQLKMGGPDSILGLALDPPDLSRLETTILLLKEAGALLLTSQGVYSKFDGDITFLGTVMASLPLDIQLTRLIMLGNVFSILEDTIVMAAWMSVRNVFLNDFHDKLAPYASKINFTASSNSDCIAYLHAHQMFAEKQRTNYFRTSNDSAKSWCKRNYLNYKGMLDANDLVIELRSRLKRVGVHEVACEGKPAWDIKDLPLIRKVVIAGAFYPNYFVRPSREGAQNEADAVRALAGKDPFSTVYIQGLPQNQPGELYAKVVKDIFERHAGVVSNVSFDGSSKVYVEFKKSLDKNLPGKISYPVYRAIKMRQLPIRIQIPMLRVPEAQERAEKAGVVSYKLSNLGKLKNHSKMWLPSKSTRDLEFIISWVNDPSDFYIQASSPAELVAVQTKLNTPGNLSPLKEVQLNGIYAAPYPSNSQQSKYYRAKLVTIEKTQSGTETGLVLFIDYGNAEVVSIKELHEIGADIQPLKSLKCVPPLAMQCTLSGLSPSCLKNNGLWSKQAVKIVKQFEGEELMLGDIYSVVDSVVSLKNVRPRQGKHKSINEILVEDGLADQVEESYRSKMDNLERESCSDLQTGNSAVIGCREQFNIHMVQHKTDKDSYIDPPSHQECQTVVTMRGPSSPLEIKVSGCTRVAEGKDIRIDPDSVNSVLLDSNPEDPHERLLVAGHVGTNPTGERMKIGHTTLMPNIHGFSALMCLIFSPTVELRLSKDKSRFIGTLCGLGCDKMSGKPYFPENDMEITFDCKIDLEDIIKINVLRFNMSKPLETLEGDDICDASLAEILRYQKRTMDLILPLLQKTREDIELEMFPRPLRWLQYDARLLLEPDIEAERSVFRPLNGLRVGD